MAAVATLWQDALDAKVDLHNFWTSTAGVRFGNAFKRATEYGVAPMLPYEDEFRTSPYEHLPEREATIMARAEPFFVSEEILEVIEEAQETFEPEAFQETDVITPYGFVLLPRAHNIIDSNGLSTTIRAFAWGPLAQVGPMRTLGRRGVWISFYSDVTDFAEDESMLANPDPSLLQPGAWESRYVLLHAGPWWYGEKPSDHVEKAVRKVGYTDETIAATTNSWWKFVQVFMRLTMQYVSVRQKMMPTRQSRRRLERAKLDLTWTTVITLRRPKPKHYDGEGHIEYQHRFWVGGHWRQQWYPSLGMHRQIWISDYIKGPEDKPLALRKGRAFVFKR